MSFDQNRRAYEKLKMFSEKANKSTGTTHPCDKERWLDFVLMCSEDAAFENPEELKNILINDFQWSAKMAENI